MNSGINKLKIEYNGSLVNHVSWFTNKLKISDKNP